MRALFHLLHVIRNDFKVWLKLNYSYPRKEFYKRVKSIVSSDLKLKKGTVIEANVQISNHLKEAGKYIYIANNTYIGFCSKIGSFTSISFGVKIGLREHPLVFVSSSPVFYAKRRGWVSDDRFNETSDGMVEIGNDVLISANAVILSGVKIGNGAVIAAGAVVNKDVEPYAIVGGVPAKFIRYRFDEKIRKGLSDSHWWDKEDEDLKKMLPYFNNPEDFLANFTKH
ncbi:MAG: hexapeptide repeat-containing protein acetyltransferase [Bacteroidetes bacterium]|jgi:acetyltransferase-like isoleucine patch superfamily enzyme|nr:hexapeptide repeat-containing protein acetyltransferase [Bacteroidota bacterium]